MQYIKVLATDSTNNELKKRFRANRNLQDCCLWTPHQKKGRGQRTETWQTEPHKNLTFSLLLNNLNLKIENNFTLSALTSLAVYEFIADILTEHNVFIKWPNDILADEKKICGILIENMIRRKNIQQTIIGIGLNVNQTAFKNLTKATSLKLLTQKEFEVTALLPQLAEKIKEKIQQNLNLPFSEIINTYYKHLFYYQQKATFELPDGSQKKGVIQGITQSGQLQIRFENTVNKFAVKEIKLLY